MGARVAPYYMLIIYKAHQIWLNNVSWFPLYTLTQNYDIEVFRMPETPPVPPKMTTLKIFLGTFQNISNKKKKLCEHFLDLEKFCLGKWIRPITPEILISQKISLILKLFRLKRSTKKVSCVFSEKSIFKKLKFRVWT